MEDGIKSLPRTLNVLETDQVYFTRPGGTSTLNGVVNIGGGGWGSSNAAPDFNRSFANGNVTLAINAEAGFTGNLIACSLAGSFRFLVAGDGHGQFNSNVFAPNFAVLGPSISGTPASSLVAGGSLTIGTTYFYVVTYFDVYGREFAQTAQTTGQTPTSGNQSITVTWNAPQNMGPAWYRVYRTTTSGVYTSANYYIVAAPALTFTDTGQAASGTATPGISTSSTHGFEINNSQTAPSFIQQIGNTNANFSQCLNLGSGPLDGATTGFFTGNVNGTILGINATSGYTGDLFHSQVAGSSKFKVDNAGNITFAGVMTPSALDTMVYATPLTLTTTAAELHKTTTTSAVGNATINASGAGTAGQRMTVLITNDATLGRTITFGTNFKPNSTLVGTASKSATVSFISDGTSWWETGRQTGL